VIYDLRRGETLQTAVRAVLETVDRRREGKEVADKLRAAITLASQPSPPSPEDLETLGGGWVGEEALAIAVCCALAAPDFAAGVLTAVNHSGDSDSTGAIAGNLLGCALGVGAIPVDLLGDLEGAREITQVATDLFDFFALGRSLDYERYPTW
jgi:ADP-ribosylglycohydrolase